jgi:excisionase family DNA binding protein
MTGKQIGKIVRSYVKKEVNARMNELNAILIKEFYTKKEVASMFNVSERTIDRWRENGKLTTLMEGEGKKVLFSKEEVNKLKMTRYGR